MEKAKKNRLLEILAYLEGEDAPTPEEEGQPIYAFPDEGVVGKTANALLGPIGHSRTEAEYEALWNEPTPPDEVSTPVTTRKHLSRKRAQYEA